MSKKRFGENSRQEFDSIDDCEDTVRDLRNKIKVLEGAPDDEIIEVAQQVQTSKLQLGEYMKAILDLRNAETDTSSADCLSRMMINLINSPWVTQEILFDLKEQINKFVQNIKVFSQLQGEITAMLTVLKTANINGEEYIQNASKFVINVNVIFLQYNNYKALINNLISYLENNTTVEQDFYLKHINEIKNYHSKFQEACCRIAFALLKIDPKAESKGYVDFIKTDFCPMTYDRLREYREEQYNKAYYVRAWKSIKKIYHSLDFKLIFNRIKQKIGQIISWLVDFQSTHYIAFVLGANLIATTYSVVKVTNVLESENIWINILLIIASSVCRLANNKFVVGALIAGFSSWILTSPFAAFISARVQKVVDAFKKGGEIAISQVVPLLLPSLIQNFYKSIIDFSCRVISNLATLTNFNPANIAKNLISNLPSGIIAPIQGLIDLLNSPYEDMPGKIWDYMSNISSQVPQFAGIFTDSFIAWLKSIWDTIKDKALGLFSLENVTSGIKSKTVGAFNFVTNTLNPWAVKSNVEADIIINTFKQNEQTIDTLINNTSSTINKLSGWMPELPSGREVFSKSCDLIVTTSKGMLSDFVNQSSILFDGCVDIYDKVFAFDNFVWYIGIFYKIVAGMLLVKNKISDMVGGGKRMLLIEDNFKLFDDKCGFDTDFMHAFDEFQKIAIVDVENIMRKIRGEGGVDVEMATSIAS